MPVKVDAAPSDDERLDTLSRGYVHSKLLKFAKGAELFRAREEANCVYQVISGAVRTYRLLSDGRRHINAFHLIGDIFGLENGPTYRFTAEATVDTKVRVVPRRDLFDAMISVKGGAKDLLGLITLNLIRAESRILLLGQNTAIERVAAFLLEIDQRHSHPDEIALPMTRVDIADYLGLKTETVSRAFSSMQDKEILRFKGMNGRRIILLDRERLAELEA